MPDFSSRRFILWLIITLLSLSLCGVLWEGYQRQQTKQATIDSLRTVHEQTVDDRRRYKRLANSNTEGLSNAEEREVLWATRAVLSETNNPREMLLIANVIRNRVDLGYRGRETAKEVILDPYQFSAFNPGREMRWRYINMESQHVSNERWEEAWTAARYAMTAPREVLPFDNPCVNHFVHPGSLVRHPGWMYEMEQVRLGSIQRPDIAFFRQNRTEICQSDEVKVIQ
jgi:hypothetical protein